MVGFYPDMVPVRAEKMQCKRKPDDIMEVGKRIEEKKLRVEKVVTALCNTDVKKSKNAERREQHNGEKAFEARCTCGETTASFPAPRSSYISHAYDPVTNVTYSLHTEPDKKKEHQVIDPTGHPQPIYHYIVPQQMAYRSPYVKLEPKAVKTEPPSIPPIIASSSTHKVRPVVPILPYMKNVGSPRLDSKDIIRVPRDNKTPFVVFKPELYPSNFVAVRPPYLQRAVTPVSQQVRVPIILQNNLVAMHPPPLSIRPTSSQNTLSLTNSNYQKPIIAPAVPKAPQTISEAKSNIPHTTVPTAVLRIPNFPIPSFTQQPAVSKHSVQHLIKNDDHVDDSAKMKISTINGPDTTIPLSNYPSELSAWTIYDVYKYLKGTDCSEYADVFKVQEIDGKTLPLLDEISISRLLDIKMGPAIKLTALIKSLVKKLVH